MNKRVVFFSIATLNFLLLVATSAPASAADSLLHPADKNGDWKISQEEALSFLQSWQQEETPLVYAIQAAKLWQSGGWYRFLANRPAPRCWTSGTGTEGDGGEAGWLALGSAVSRSGAAIEVPVVFKKGTADASVLLFQFTYDPEQLLLEEVLPGDALAGTSKQIDAHEAQAGRLTLAIYGGQSAIASGQTARLHFRIREETPDGTTALHAVELSGATAAAQPLFPAFRSGAVFTTAPRSR